MIFLPTAGVVVRRCILLAIQEIKEYRQKDGTDILKVIMKPTQFISDWNYFYCDAKDIDLVEKYNWSVEYNGRLFRVAYHTTDSPRRLLLFHRELACKYLNYYPDYIDHINLLEIDNVDNNLNIVTRQQNSYNRPTRGYRLITVDYFIPCLIINGASVRPYDSFKFEFEACQLQNKLETEYLRGILKDDYYMYDFLKDRRNDLDILDLERTGIISEEEATYRHVVRYAKDNAWYYYRYNLEQYFKDNHIPVPDFTTDEQGFMRHPITNQLLCPF